MGSYGDNSVVINISGDSNGLKSALTQAQEQLKAVGLAMTDVSDVAARLQGTTAESGDQWRLLAQAISPLIASLSDLREQMGATGGSLSELDAQVVADTEQLRVQRQEMVLLNDYLQIFGASLQENAAGWLNDAEGAAQYGIRLGYLREQIALANAEMSVEESQQGGGGGLFGGLFAGLQGAMGGGGGFSFGGLFAGLGLAEGPLGLLGGALDSVTSSIGGFIQQSAAMFTSLVGWQAFNDITGMVHNFVAEMFNLNDLTQKNEYTWKYLFGGGARGMGVSQHLMDWTKQASLTMPYTRQDLMGAITGMLSLPGMDSAQVEKYLPMLSDLGASRNPNLSLSQIANVVQGAEFGYTRQLRYELHINPDELIKYGLKAHQRSGGMGLSITDPSTLLPALMAYSKAHGYLGAGQDIAQNTWWGAMSSWTDRIQNFQMAAGNSMFTGMQKDLVGISSWWDQHQNDLYKFADLVGRLAGDVVTAGGGVLGALFQELGALGGPSGLQGILENVSSFLEAITKGDISVVPDWLQPFMQGAHPAVTHTVAASGGGASGGGVGRGRGGAHAAPAKATPAHTVTVPAVSGFAALGKNLADFGASVGKVFSAIGGFLHTLFKPFLDAVGPQAKTAFASLGQSFGEMWKASGPFLGFLAQALGTLFGVLGLLVGGLLQLAAVIVQVLAKGMTAGYSIMKQPLEWLRDILKELNQHFIDVANSASKFGKQVGQGVNGIGGGVGGFFNGMGTWISSGGRHYAEGGPVAGDGWALVGETGPEMVWLPNGAYVAPNRGALAPTSGGWGAPGGGSGGGTSVVVNIYGNGDAYLAEVTQDAVTRALAGQGMVTNTPGAWRSFGVRGGILGR